jgi:hypothetical protein
MAAPNQSLSEEEKMKKNLLSIALALAFALAACSPAKPTSAPSAVPANFPSGKFIKSGSEDNGFVFNEDGTYTRFEKTGTATRGTYSVDGNVYTEVSNDGGCESNISFTYTFDGKNLTFNYVGKPEDDTCGGGGRRADFNNVIYILSEE